MSIISRDGPTPTDSAKKGVWLNVMDDSCESVEAVRSAFVPRGRAEVWRRDDPGFTEAYDARFQDVDRRAMNSVRLQAQAGNLRAAALCLRIVAGLGVRAADDDTATGLPAGVASAMLDAGLAALRACGDSTAAFRSSSVPSHASPPAPRRRRR